MPWKSVRTVARSAIAHGGLLVRHLFAVVAAPLVHQSSTHAMRVPVMVCELVTLSSARSRLPNAVRLASLASVSVCNAAFNVPRAMNRSVVVPFSSNSKTSGPVNAGELITHAKINRVGARRPDMLDDACDLS